MHRTTCSGKLEKYRLYICVCRERESKREMASSSEVEVEAAAAASVQELAKERSGMLTVPQRFIQENREPTSYNYSYTATNNINRSINFSSPTNTIPVVDMKLLIEGRSKHDVKLLDHFHSICKEWGIFQVL